MTNTVRLIIALGFAGFAALLHLIWAQQNLPTYREYTGYSQGIPQGEPIDPGNFQMIRLSERTDLQHSEIFVPWENRSTLAGLRASREIHEGELALKTDGSGKGVLPEFSTLGPFRLLTVGGGQNATITLAVKNTSRGKKDVSGKKDHPVTYEDDVTQLLNILGRGESGRIRSDASIQAVVAIPGQPSLVSGEEENELREGEVALMINLPNVPVEPSILLKGSTSFIGFVVPASIIPE